MAASNQELRERLQDAHSTRSRELAQQYEQETHRRAIAKKRALAREGKIDSLINDIEWYEQQFERLNNEKSAHIAELKAAIENSQELAADFATLNDKLASVTDQKNYYQERTFHGTKTIKTLNQRQKDLQKQYKDIKEDSEEKDYRHWQEQNRIETKAGLHLIKEDGKRLFSNAEQKAIDAAGKPANPSHQQQTLNLLNNLFEALLGTSDAPISSDQPSNVQEKYKELQQHAENQQALINSFKNKFDRCATLVDKLIHRDSTLPDHEAEMERLSKQLRKELGI